jgi:hypothetical protein
MQTFDDAERIGLRLPATEAAAGELRVAGKMFAWIYPERVEEGRPRVPNPEVLVVWVPDLQTKDALVAAEPELFFTTQHYDGYRAVLVRLPMVDAARLTELLIEAWRSRAPKALVREFDAG